VPTSSSDITLMICGCPHERDGTLIAIRGEFPKGGSIMLSMSMVTRRFTRAALRCITYMLN